MTDKKIRMASIPKFINESPIARVQAIDATQLAIEELHADMQLILETYPKSKLSSAKKDRLPTRTDQPRDNQHSETDNYSIFTTLEIYYHLS